MEEKSIEPSAIYVGYMRFFWKSLQALGIAFQKPLTEWFGLVPIRAKVSVASYFPLTLDEKKSTSKKTADELENALAALKAIGDTSAAPDTTITVEIENKGDKVLPHVRAKMADKATFQLVKEGAPSVVGREIDMGDLMPGEIPTVRIWTRAYLAGEYTLKGKFQTVSDAGIIPFSAEVPKSEQFYSNGSLYEKFDEWILVGLGVFSIVMIIVLYVYIVIQDARQKDLLSDDAFYVREKVRYEREYKKFSPNVEHFGEYTKRFKARKANHEIDELSS